MYFRPVLHFPKSSPNVEENANFVLSGWEKWGNWRKNHEEFRSNHVKISPFPQLGHFDDFQAIRAQCVYTVQFINYNF